MGKATNLFASTDGYKLRKAIGELGKYYGVKDASTFMQTLLSSTQSADDKSPISTSDLSKGLENANSHLEVLADAILGLQGDGLYVEDMIKAFEKYIEGEGDDPIAQNLKDITKDPVISITHPNDGVPDKGYLRDLSIKDCLGLQADFEEDRTMTCIEMHHPYLNFANRDSSAAAIFLQSIPSIEISKAVPFLDVKCITKGAPVGPKNGVEKNGEVFSNGISIYKFLHGEQVVESNSVIDTLIKGVPAEMLSQEMSIQGQAGENDSGITNTPVTAAGMELFTSPQTLVNADIFHKDLNTTATNYGEGATPEDIPLENKVLDKFRPLMTMESFNVQVTPASGMIATKAAEVKIKLHDKTRMHQIAPLIVPSQLQDIEFLCEWGWSHPQTDYEENVYGALINSFRIKEKYGVMNSSYTFTPEGQVDISLKLYTKGAQKATFELVTNYTPENGKSAEHPQDVLKKLVTGIRKSMRTLKQEGFTPNAEMGAPDVLGKAASVNGLLSLTEEQRTSITKFLKKMSENGSTASRTHWGGLAGEWEKAETGVENYQKHIEENFKRQLSNCLGQDFNPKGKNATKIEAKRDDPWMPLVDVEEKTQDGKVCVQYGHSTHVSFGKVLMNFVGQPLFETKRFNEIQFVFYPMNEFAMFARGLSIASYPINKTTLNELLLEELKKTPSITIQKFLNIMKKLFINFIGDDIYGLSAEYSETDDKGKRVLAKKYTENDEGKQAFASRKHDVLTACYKDGQKTFKKPNINMWVECVNNVADQEKTILRLHFFDRATTSYSGYSQAWSAASGGDLGIIGKYKSAEKSYNAMSEEPDKKSKSYEQWQARHDSRKNRVTKFRPEFEKQIGKFISAGLIEAFDVKTQTIENGEKVEKTESRFRIKGGPDQLRGILAANMPTLKYGTEFSGILGASLSTNSNPAMETIHMQRQGKSGGSSNIDAGLPLQIKPVTLSIETFGCPFINFGQQFFVDFQTNTTIDDIYAVTGVSHSLTPGEFKSSITLSPLNKLGQFKSLTDTFDDAAAVAAQVSENID